MRRPERREIRVVALATALVLALGVAPLQGTPSAFAAPTGPSWDDVQAAKGDVDATEIAIARILESVGAMNAEFEQLSIAALIAGEQNQQATVALERAEGEMATAERRRDAARERSDASGQQAAQLAAQLARAGGGDLTMTLLVSGDDADDLLYRLGTMSALSTRTDAVLSRALQDRNVAATLSDQAAEARDAHAQLAIDAEAAYALAADAAAEAEQRATEQQVRLDELSAKLAELTGRSAAVERAYLDSLETGPPPAGGPAPGPSPSNPGQPAPSPSAPSQPSPTPSAPAPGPSPSSPAPSPAPSSPAPGPTSPPASGPQPNAAAVATAIAFARAQLGEPYQFGAAGPDAWDCSGLTMMAYSAAGLAIGGHGATSQYTRAASRGLLVPYSQAVAGDLVFYSTGGATGGSKYHVALYIGGGQMLEAPSPGRPVRIVWVRSYDLVPLVARPSG